MARNAGEVREGGREGGGVTREARERGTRTLKDGRGCEETEDTARRYSRSESADGGGGREVEEIEIGGCVLPRRDTVPGTPACEGVGGKGKEGGGETGLDFWCIGVLIPTLNYPLSWAQLGPLVKTPPLFVLRSR